MRRVAQCLIRLGFHSLLCHIHGEVSTHAFLPLLCRLALRLGQPAGKETTAAICRRSLYCCDNSRPRGLRAPFCRKAKVVPKTAVGMPKTIHFLLDCLELGCLANCIEPAEDRKPVASDCQG